MKNRKKNSLYRGLIIILILVFTVTFAVTLFAAGIGEGPSGGTGSAGTGGSDTDKTGETGGSGKEGGYYYSEEKLQNLGPYAGAAFAGGCFWCLEQPFEKYIGVAEVISGYTGGEKENPAYREVASGKTDHIEAVMVYYNPEVISYEQLLEIFWRNIDPTDEGGQFVDRGDHYTTAIFYSTPGEKRAAEESKKTLEESGKFTKPIVTALREAGPFYPAEEYHQDFFIKSSAHYKRYRSGSGRDQFIEGNWVSPGDAAVPESLRGLELREERYGAVDKEARLEELTALQYSVTQKDDTEPPFQNKYWSNKEEGIYVDIVSGEPLFSSTDKYQSGTGWPSFTRPIEPDHIIYKTDTKLASTRVEVRSYYADSHLGHVFEDGPEPTGLRYCINSAALRFVPREKMEEEGYAQYMVLF